MADNTGRDVATLLRKGAQFAFGAFNPGEQADAGTSGKIGIGDRLRSGFEAISPAARDFGEFQDTREKTSAEINKLNEEARVERAEQEALQTPFDIDSIIDGADPTGTLKPKIQKIFDAADVNQDGFTNRQEIEDGIESGAINMQEVSNAIAESVSTLKNNVIDINSLDIDQKLAAINVRGGGTITREMFKQNPTLATSNKPLAILIQEEAKAKEQLKALMGAQAQIAKDIKAREAVPSVAEEKFRRTTDPAFNTRLNTDVIPTINSIGRGQFASDNPIAALAATVAELRNEFSGQDADIARALRTPVSLALLQLKESKKKFAGIDIGSAMAAVFGN